MPSFGSMRMTSCRVRCRQRSEGSTYSRRAHASMYRVDTGTRRTRARTPLPARASFRAALGGHRACVAPRGAAAQSDLVEGADRALGPRRDRRERARARTTVALPLLRLALNRFARGIRLRRSWRRNRFMRGGAKKTADRGEVASDADRNDRNEDDRKLGART